MLVLEAAVLLVDRLTAGSSLVVGCGSLLDFGNRSQDGKEDRFLKIYGVSPSS